MPGGSINRLTKKWRQLSLDVILPRWANIERDHNLVMGYIYLKAEVSTLSFSI